MSDPLNVVSSNTDYTAIPAWHVLGDNADESTTGACVVHVEAREDIG